MRGTGRTTRMIEEAVKLAKEGRAVYVVATKPMAPTIEAKVAELLPDGLVGGEWPKVESPTSLGRGWDSLRMRVAGAHPNCVVLCDHYVIEREYATVLEMLHRFDEK